MRNTYNPGLTIQDPQMYKSPHPHHHSPLSLSPFNAPQQIPTPPPSPTAAKIPPNSFLHTLYPELVREKQTPIPLSPTTPTRPPLPIGRSSPSPLSSCTSSSPSPSPPPTRSPPTSNRPPPSQLAISAIPSTPSYTPAPSALLNLDPNFSEAPKCHITDFVVSLFDKLDKSQECTFQLFASRCWAMRRKLDSHYTSLRAQAFLDTLQRLNHPHVAAPTAHFPSAGQYYSVYPLYAPLMGLSRKDKHQLWEGLCALHNVGLRHGDVNLRNVLRDEKGNVVLILGETAMHETELSSTTNDVEQFERNIASAPERKADEYILATPVEAPVPVEAEVIERDRLIKRKRSEWEDREREEIAKEQWARGEWCRDGVKVDVRAGVAVVGDKRPMWTM